MHAEHVWNNDWQGKTVRTLSSAYLIVTLFTAVWELCMLLLPLTSTQEIFITCHRFCCYFCFTMISNLGALTTSGKTKCWELLGIKHNLCWFSISNKLLCGPGSSVSIATELWAGWSRIESWWGRDFLPVQTSPGAHPASCKMGTGSFPGVKWGRGVLLTTHLLLVPRSWKSRVISLPTLWATAGL